MSEYKPAERISHLKPYFFATLGKRIVQMRADGVDVIRLDMGSPDLPPADFIVDALVESARKADVHGYTLGAGTQNFRKAVAQRYLDRFGVELDPGSEVLDLIGSKEGLFELSQAFLNPGDLVLVPDPGYAVYASGARIVGAEIGYMPLLAENNFFPDMEAIPEDVAKRAKVMWLNYPNNPTGATATVEDFAKVVEFARKYDILIAHDAPYTEVGFDGYRAPSLLEVLGAKEVAIEFNSLSKAYNMAGWRLGSAVGNAQIVKYLETYKSQQDSAHFAPMFNAGIAALSGDQSWTEERNAIYQKRRDLALDGLKKAGLKADVPQAAMYIWVHIPEGENSMDFCARMLEETGVSMTPGNVFGAHGEGYLRISLVTTLERIEEGMGRVVDWLKVKA
ncbi:MAG: aminotransferase class I/II-fold pyridoxal phosphate-dependent enzyme [Chloroflexi bacterium]|nr:MAG: aminotransferase class I/II-fold pyridoxal phosphate-dependent enzyme [Chloroflexota bacterium]MBL1193736.1 aminotransferase class I/II-fold pyridoxal phosphate-dependent enzyme [Chloroflexota bacterium]NOH11029.1 aminotransferase class I/II-fold pyridoxal phosphate-dependent enzyme [Chloroflexota bacterium]